MDSCGCILSRIFLYTSVATPSISLSTFWSACLPLLIFFSLVHFICFLSFSYACEFFIILKEILALKDFEERKVESMLKEMLEKHRGKIEEVAEENLEYDEEFASIGKGKKTDEMDEAEENE